MKLRSLSLAAAALALLHAVPAPAQTIRAGMTVDEVRALLGPPAVVRESGEWRYLFYANGCAPRCGSDDVVFVRDGRVVTAVFRTPRRRFAGPSPSTALEGEAGEARPGIRVLGTPAGEVRPPAREGAEVRGIRVVVPGTEDVSLGGRPGTIIIRDLPEPDTLLADTVFADTALDRSRQLREQRVVPRTVSPDQPSDVRPDTALDRRRQEREERVEPRTVRPRTNRPPR